VPSGHGSRYALESSPDARTTACRIPEVVAVVKKSSKKRVRTAIIVVISLAAPPSSDSSGATVPSTSLVKKSMPTARTSGAA
jgi:hypothetical protein